MVTTKRKPVLKNTYSTSKNIFTHIQHTLSNHGVKELAHQFGEDGKVVGMTFSIPVGDRLLKYKMPVDVEGTRQALLKRANTPLQLREATYDKAYQVAWATIRDLIDVMMALVDIRAGITVEQILLPFLLNRAEDQTFYQIMEAEKFLMPADQDVGRNFYRIEQGKD